MPKFRTAYGSKIKVTVDFDAELEPSMTKQNHTAECDINNIMAKYKRTGLIDHVNHYQGEYADVTNLGDFQEALNTVAAAQEAFDQLPASVRKEFDNDPGKFVHFVENPDNIDKMVEMGLATRPNPVPERDPKGDLSVPPENQNEAS